MNTKEIRIGVMGTLRGGSYIENFGYVEGARVTAICESNPKSLDGVQKFITEDVKIFDNFDEFINSGLFDAVMLSSYFFEHVSYPCFVNTKKSSGCQVTPIYLFTMDATIPQKKGLLLA